MGDEELCLSVRGETYHVIFAVRISLCREALTCSTGVCLDRPTGFR